MSGNEAQIERYLKGQMSEVEQQDFELFMQANPDVEAELRTHLLAQGSIWEAGIKAEKAKLNQLFGRSARDIEPGSAGSNRFRPQAWLSIAAAIVLLVAAGYFLLNRPADPQELFASYYESPSAPEQMGAPGIDSLLQLAHTQYNQKHYSEAIALYTRVTQLNGRAESWQYLAYAYLNLGKSQQAIDALLNDTQPNDMSEWYLAMAYLQADQTKEARKVLKQIAKDEGHDYQEQAEELISRFAD